MRVWQKGGLEGFPRILKGNGMGRARRSHCPLRVFPVSAPLHQPQFSGLIPGLWYTQQPGSFCPPAKFSFIRPTHILTGGFFNTSWPASLALGPSRKEGESFPGLLLSSSHHQPSHPLPIPPLLEARASGAAVLATATTPHATTVTIAITTATSTSPLNLGSCLLFPAQASGCLLLGSAHPLGSTVRLRDPAQGRQTGLRTSVLPWRTGSRKRRYGTEPLPLACLPLPATLDPPVSFSAHLQSLPESLSLSLPSFTLFARPLSSLLPQRRLHATSVPTPHSGKKSVASSSSKGSVVIWLSLIFSASLLFLNVARVGEKEVGTSGRALTAGWVRKMGP